MIIKPYSLGPGYRVLRKPIAGAGSGFICRVHLKNIKNKEALTFKLVRIDSSRISVSMLHKDERVGGFIFAEREGCLDLFQIHVKGSEKGRGSTAFAFLSKLARSQNKTLQASLINNTTIIHIMFKFFSDVKIKIGSSWESRTEEQIVKIFWDDMMKAPHEQHVVYLRGYPKADH